MLPNLKHFSLQLSDYCNDNMRTAGERYFATCSPLQSLSLWSWSQIVSLPVILNSHGPTLRLLHLHEQESFDEDGEGMRRLLSVEEVKLIKDTCPNLQDFTMDLDRHAQ